MRLLVIALLALAGGLACKDHVPDSVRAQRERDAVRAKLSSSLVLVPWRGMKTVMRAHAVTPPPPKVAELVALAEKQRQTPDDLKGLVVLLGRLYEARSILKDEDEDRYPTLWQATAPPQPAGYDAAIEHGILAVAMVLLDASLRREPIAEILFYEVDRATPHPGWPRWLTADLGLVRGAAYLNAGYHYAAEEELTQSLDALGKLGPSERPSYPEGLPSLQLAGHMLRAWNRLALDRDEPATDDLEAALADCKELGLDNELTDWVGVTVAIRRDRPAEAAQRLLKLSASPYLDDAEKAQIRDYATKLDKKRMLFGKGRAQLILVRALVARAGGVEKILGRATTPEQASRLMGPLSFLSNVQTKIGSSVDDTEAKAKSLGQSALERAKALTGK